MNLAHTIAIHDQISKATFLPIQISECRGIGHLIQITDLSL